MLASYLRKVDPPNNAIVRLFLKKTILKGSRRMKKSKYFLNLLLVFFLVFNFTSIGFAEGKTKPVSQEKAPRNIKESREEITFDFDDASDAPWAGEYIGKMQSKKVIKGYDDGKFRPNEPVTRIEAIVMAVRLMGLEKEALSQPSDMALHFRDSSQIPSWGRGHVIVALENGLFIATEDKIHPNKPASRVWIVRMNLIFCGNK